MRAPPESERPRCQAAQIANVISPKTLIETTADVQARSLRLAVLFVPGHCLHHCDPRLRGVAMNAHTKIEALNIEALRLDVRNAIATATIAEFENQSHHLGHGTPTGLLRRAAAADRLIAP